MTNPTPPAPPSDDKVEKVARDLYAAACALDPLAAERQPDWGRTGYKTEVMYWHGLARAAIAAMQPEGWQPIGDQHRNGEWWLLCEADPYVMPAMYAGCWNTAGGYWQANCGQNVTQSPEPTHAMPLPAAPIAAATSGKEGGR